MKKVKIVIGANYGNEGKGLMTDYFCKQVPRHEKVLNIRFNGGAQAGHRVETPGGRRHIFRHFGSGSLLPNVATYLTEDFVINPILFRKEYEDLYLPMVYCSPKCLITFPQDMMISSFLAERNPGNDFYKSDKGIGMYETMLRSQKGSEVSIATLTVLGMRHFQIDIEYYTIERIEKIFGIRLTESEKIKLNDQHIRASFAQDLKFLMDHISPIDERIFKQFNYLVFEGAHGLLHDKKHRDHGPYLAQDDSGLGNIAQHISGQWETEVCYVTRPYLSEDRTEPMNISKLTERCEKDFEQIPHDHAKLSYAVTHMDEALNSDLMPYSDDLYLSYGPTRDDIKKVFDDELPTKDDEL